MDGKPEDGKVRYAIEGRRKDGPWVTFDTADSEEQGLEFRDRWAQARDYMEFRLVRVTTRTISEVIR